jgi:hypothetical protein
MNPGQAAEIASHYHLFIVTTFIVGFLIHAGLQVNAIAKAKNNPLNTEWAVIKQNWITLAARFFVSLLLFIYVWNNPSTLPTVIWYFGVTLSANTIAILTLPMSPEVAGIMGFSVDSLLAYIPYLKNALPPIQGVQGALLDDAADHLAVAKDEVEQAQYTPPEKP